MTPRVSTGKNHAAHPGPERRPQGRGYATRQDGGDTPHALQGMQPVPHDRSRDSRQSRLMRAQRPVRAPSTGLGSVFTLPAGQTQDSAMAADWGCGDSMSALDEVMLSRRITSV